MPSASGRPPWRRKQKGSDCMRNGSQSNNGSRLIIISEKGVTNV
jgi:hypothetical protein